MYRIELSPGDETVFRSIEELAVAIRRGVVTPRARIYHNATGRWLPIQFHPHYKTAASMPLTSAALVAGPPVKPLSTLKLEQPSEPEPIATALPPSASLESTGFSSGQKSARKTRASAEAAKRRRRTGAKPRRQLRIALVGALLIGGAQWVLSAPLFSRADSPVLIRAHRQLISVPTEAMKRVSSPNSAGMVPVMADSPAAAATTPLNELTDEPGSSVPSFGGTSVALPDIGAEVDPTAPKIDAAVPGRRVDSVRSGPGDSIQSKAIKDILRAVKR
jgi:hypothetical protein